MALSQRLPSIVPHALLQAIAERYGFRTGDYSLVWDGGQFDPSRGVHDLAFVVGDGRRAIARLNHADILPGDPWKYLGKLEAALDQLASRQA